MRVVIAEDSALIREALAALIISVGHEVIALASGGPEAVALTLRHLPDLVVMDVRMPEYDEGIQAAKEIRQAHPDMPILLLSQNLQPRGTAELLRHPGTGYLLKDRVLDVEDFLQALQRVASAGIALDPAVVKELIDSASRTMDALSDRELDVLGLVAEGRSNAAIAEKLCLSLRTVETHIGNVLVKLGIDNSPETHRRVQAVLAYLRGNS